VFRQGAETLVPTKDGKEHKKLKFGLFVLQKIP